MTPGNTCYYGRHIGCPNADDPNCRRCAERLTKAVHVLNVPEHQSFHRGLNAPLNA
ncbi:MAG: hypothetical protein ACXV5H_11680 [Halobacteriota archaeon]